MDLGGIMAGKLSFIVGLGAGYVVGARSGRERYDQIAAKAQELWRNPRVQEKAGQAQQVVQEKAGQAGQAVKSKVGSTGSSDDTGAHKSSGVTAGVSGGSVS
jgi:hypothetical protein